jgi:hypothetical protein
MLGEHLDLLNHVALTPLSYGGRDWDFFDICFKADQVSGFDNEVAMLEAMFGEGAVPWEACIMLSPIMCFNEGNLFYPIKDDDMDFLAEQAKQGFGYDLADQGFLLYSLKPSFRNLTTDAILAEFTKQECMFVDIFLPPTEQLFAEVKYDKDQPDQISFVGGMQTNIISFEAHAVYQRFGEEMGEELPFFEKLVDEWDNQFIELVSNWKGQGIADHYALTVASVEKSAAEFGVGTMELVLYGALLSVIYAVIVFSPLVGAISHGKSSFGWSLSFVGFLGIVLVLLGTMASVGLASLLGIKFGPDALQVLPFIGLGVGVDDMFVIAHTFQRCASTGFADHKDLMAETLGWAGPSISLTTTANFGAFIVGALVPVEAVRTFCIECAILVSVLYVTNVICFSSVLALAAKAVHAKSLKLPPGSPGSPGVTLNDGSSSKFWKDFGAAVSFRNGKPVASHVIATIAAIFVVNTVILGASIWGATQVELGLNPKDLTKRGTTIHGYFENAYDSFNARSANMVSMTQDYADPINQQSLSDTMAIIRNHPQVTTNGDLLWVDYLAEYCRDPEAYAHEYQVAENGFCAAETFYEALQGWETHPLSSLVALKSESFAFSYTDKKFHKPDERPLEARLDITENRIFYILPDNYVPDDILSVISDFREVLLPSCRPACLPSFLPACLPSFASLLPSFLPSFISPSLLPSFLSVISDFWEVLLPSWFLPSFLPAFLPLHPFFLPSFLPTSPSSLTSGRYSSLPPFLPSFLPACLPSFLYIPSSFLLFFLPLRHL